MSASSQGNIRTANTQLTDLEKRSGWKGNEVDAYKPMWSQLSNVTPASVTEDGNCTCLECKHKFTARTDAKFCGPNCRKQASRRKERTRRMASNVISALANIERMVRDYPDVAIVASLEIERIRNRLNVTLAGVTPKDD